jgi:hypothetical protein
MPSGMTCPPGTGIAVEISTSDKPLEEGAGDALSPFVSS